MNSTYFPNQCDYENPRVRWTCARLGTTNSFCSSFSDNEFLSGNDESWNNFESLAIPNIVETKCKKLSGLTIYPEGNYLLELHQIFNIVQDWRLARMSFPNRQINKQGDFYLDGGEQHSNPLLTHSAQSSGTERTKS